MSPAYSVARMLTRLGSGEDACVMGSEAGRASASAFGLLLDTPSMASLLSAIIIQFIRAGQAVGK